MLCTFIKGFPCGSARKESACNAGDLGLIPGLVRSPWEGKGYPLLYSDLKNSLNCLVRGVAKSQTQLSNFLFTVFIEVELFASSQYFWVLSMLLSCIAFNLCVLCSVDRSCLTLCDPTRFLCPWNFPGKNTGAGCCFLLQRIFLTQRLNPFLFHFLHWQVDSLPPCHLGSPLSWINAPKFIHLFSSLWPFGIFLVFYYCE